MFKKLDRILAPYSTLLALGTVGMIGLFFIFCAHETRALGIGVILGGFLSIGFKAACEVSDRETWQRICTFFGRKHDDNSR
jgi:hypothetical protein